MCEWLERKDFVKDLWNEKGRSEFPQYKQSLTVSYGVNRTKIIYFLEMLEFEACWINA